MSGPRICAKKCSKRQGCCSGGTTRVQRQKKPKEPKEGGARPLNKEQSAFPRDA